MREIRHLTEDDARRVPWKNGRGTTLELCVWPDDAAFARGDFDVRVSKAAVVEDGPFSTFPDFDRILVVTSGAGLELTHGDDRARVRLRPLEPHRFPGDVATHATLLAGRVDDFNVMTRRGRCTADAQVLRLGARRARENTGESHTFVHVLQGHVTARVGGEEESFELGTGHTLWAIDTGRDEVIDFAGRAAEACVLIVRVDSSRPDRS